MATFSTVPRCPRCGVAMEAAKEDGSVEYRDGQGLTLKIRAPEAGQLWLCPCGAVEARRA